ncbi:MAG: hypothetical protein GY941_15785 [Planctomycetes bacterium]|nr:hypothetical protein [Planctomycetota bacterium]
MTIGSGWVEGAWAEGAWAESAWAQTDTTNPIGLGWAEGAWIDASWVVGAWEQTAATTKTIGDVSQLEAFSSTGGIALERTIGGVSQLESFTSTGGIQAGDIVEPVSGGGGGNIGLLYKGVSLPESIDAYEINSPSISKPTPQSEIERRQEVIKSLADQIIIVESKIEILSISEDIDELIQAEELRLDTFHVEQYIDQLLLDVHDLRTLKRRREEEELIIMLLNNWSVSVH